MCGSPAAAPALFRNRVTVCRSRARPFSRGSSSGWSGRDVLGAVVVDELHQVRVQRQVAVLAQLPDRDVKPGCGTDLHDRVGGQAGELTDPKPGAQQYLDGHAHQQPLVVVCSSEQFCGGGVVEGLGQWVVLSGQVTGKHRHPRRCLVPAPFVDADEEHPQGAEPVRQRGIRDPCLVLTRSCSQPRLVVLDVATPHLPGAGDLRGSLDQERGEGAQSEVGAGHAAWSEHARDLAEVAAHRVHDLRAHPELLPAGQQQRPAHSVLRSGAVIGWSA